MQRLESQDSRISLSFIISSHGEARRVSQVLSSMPRSDIIAMQLEPSDEPNALRLRNLPLTPFPVHSGMTVLTHLFGASNAPPVIRSQSRLPPSAKQYPNIEEVEAPVKWLDGQAWRRWGAGNMLGYRSYTNIEVEVRLTSTCRGKCLLTLTGWYSFVIAAHINVHSAWPGVFRWTPCQFRDWSCSWCYQRTTYGQPCRR